MKKSSIIQLPLSVTLTDEGKYFFNRRDRGAGHTGMSFVGDDIHISTYRAKTLQRLVYAGYVSRIELSRSDFLSKRAEIMDVSKLIAYAILYKKFGMMLGRELADTAPVMQWNRKHPQRRLDETTMVGDAEKVLGHQEVRDMLSGMVRRCVAALDEEDGSLSTEEREIARLKGEHFLESLNPLLWGLLIKNTDGGARNAVVGEIEKVLKSFIRKTVIADFLSLLIMELAAYAETSLLKRALEENPAGGPDFQTLVQNAALRKQVLASLEESRRHATLAWRIQGQRFSIEKDKATHIMLYNRVLNSREVSREIENTNSMAVDGYGLAEFYRKKDGELTGRLGLSYLSCLQDACNSLGVRFNSYVNRVADLDITLITLMLRL